MNIPVAPTLSTITSTSFVITVGADGNPVGTFYAFQVVYNSLTKYVNSMGVLQDAKVFLNVPSITLLGVLPNTFHSVSLSAADDVTGLNETAAGPVATATTLASLPLALPYSSVYSTTFIATWNVNSNPVSTQFLAETSPDPSFIFNVSSSGWITGSSYTFTNLLPNTTYYSRVSARNSVLVATSSVSLGPTVTPIGPEPIRALHVYNLFAERGFLLKWGSGLENNLVNYRIYRSSSPSDNGSFDLIATTPVNVTSYIDNVPFTFGLTWYYKVTALDNGNNEGALERTTPVNDMTYHSFEEQPFPTTVSALDFVTDEIPSGVVDDVNIVFSTTSAFRKGSLQVYLNGVRMHHTIDFVEGPGPQQFTMVDAPAVSGVLRISYTKY